MTRRALRPDSKLRHRAAVLTLAAVIAGASGSAAVAASGGSVARAQAICRSDTKAIMALGQAPSIHDAKAYASYLTRALGYVSRALKEVRALHWTSSIAHALRVEASGLKIEYQEVPAIRAGNTALARQLGNRAATLTQPADLVLTRAGLGVCVSSG
jgi:hypothetical protein